MSKKLTLKNKLAFASADFFGGGSFNIVNFLYTPFLAMVIGLEPFMIAAVMLIARIWDAVIDPVIGRISDATNSKFSKRRIFLLITSPLIAISFFILFLPLSINGTVIKVIIVLATYLIFCTVQSLVMIPYYSLSSEISTDFNERASANTYRLGFSLLASIVCVAGAQLIKGSMGNKGYTVIGLLFGLLFAVSVFITAIFAREAVQYPPVKQKASLSNFLRPFKIKPFREYFIMFMALQVTMAVMSAVYVFFMDFFYFAELTANRAPNVLASTLAPALLFVVQIFALPFYLHLMKKKDKAYAYRVGAIIWLLSSLAILVLPQNGHEIILYAVTIVIAFGISGPGLAPHAMFGDIADVAQLMFKQRIDGSISGLVNFFNQIAQAVGVALAMFILGLAKFQEQVYDANGDPTIFSQDIRAQIAIKLILALTPVILLSIGITASYSYKLNKRKHEKVLQFISEGKDLTEREVNELFKD